MGLAAFIVGAPWVPERQAFDAMAIIGFVVAVVGVIVALGWWVAGRSLERQLVLFRRGDHLAKWTLQPDEWNPFAREMGDRARLGVTIFAALIVVIGVVVGAIILYKEGDPVGETVMIGSVVGGVATGLGLRAFSTSYWKPTKRPVTVVYGSTAGILNGKIVPWGTFGYTLTGVELDELGQRVVVRVLANTGEGTTLVTHRLPFPRRAVKEARELVKALARDIPPG